jgi:hypothetical protein
MTEEERVAWIVDYVEVRPHASGEELVGGLQSVGVSQADASRALNFTRMAWGRIMLGQMGVNLTDWYTCFNAEGEVVEQGKFLENQQYAAAHRLAAQYQAWDVFRVVALGWAEAKQVMGGIEGGILPQKLGMPPVYMMLETPTAAGLARAQSYVESRAAEDGRMVDAVARENGVLPEPAAVAAAEAPMAAPQPVAKKRAWWKIW